MKLQEPRHRVWFFPRWYPDVHDEMLGLFIRRHAVAVTGLHNVFVIYSSPAPESHLTDEITETSFGEVVEFRGYYRHSGIPFLGPLLNMTRYLLSVIKIASRCRKKYGLPDINHVHVLTRAAAVPLFMKLRYGIPYVITEHWSRYLPENLRAGSYSGFLRKLMTRIAVKNSDGVSTVTDNLAKAMRSAGLHHKKYMVIPNVADSALFRPAAEKAPHDVKKLIHISCFDEKAKNIKGIIDATSELSVSRDDFDMEIIGTGPDFEMITDYAAAKQAEGSQIRFAGLLEGEVLADRMREADLLVMFSNYENLPCTIVESITSGVPVVSTDVGGISEFLSPQFGKLIKRNDKEGLKSFLNDYLDNKFEFDTKGMREFALQNFSNEAVADKFDELYKRSIG